MNNKLPSLLSGFSQKYITKHTIFDLFLNWQENLTAGNLTSTILIDLSKAYVTLPHALLLAKLEAYGFHTENVELIRNFLIFENAELK